MARSAYQDHGADWVINNDADEFWMFPDGDAPSFLDSVAPGIAGLFVQRFNAVLPESGRRRDGLAHPSQSCFFWREVLMRFTVLCLLSACIVPLLM